MHGSPCLVTRVSLNSLAAITRSVNNEEIRKWETSLTNQQKGQGKKNTKQQYIGRLIKRYEVFEAKQC